MHCNSSLVMSFYKYGFSSVSLSSISIKKVQNSRKNSKFILKFFNFCQSLPHKLDIKCLQRISTFKPWILPQFFFHISLNPYIAFLASTVQVAQNAAFKALFKEVKHWLFEAFHLNISYGIVCNKKERRTMVESFKSFKEVKAESKLPTIFGTKANECKRIFKALCNSRIVCFRK